METWVTFCISTYKRPAILLEQLKLLSRQTFPFFRVVVSDNDPEASAKEVVQSLEDERFRYFHNAENLGMIRSFNKSIERAETDYVVLVTDDDPVQPDFLEEMFKLYQDNPEVSIYCGFIRTNRKEKEVEIISKESFAYEVLNPRRTSNLLWSSAVMRKSDVLKIGSIPDYGSPHLADHAFIVLIGSQNGGVIINKIFSSLTSHDNNFSKFNFNYYIEGCKGFYKTLQASISVRTGDTKTGRAINLHLGTWFITNVFSLKRYYVIKKDKEKLIEIQAFADELLCLPYLKNIKFRYFVKNLFFFIKSKLDLL